MIAKSSLTVTARPFYGFLEAVRCASTYLRKIDRHRALDYKRSIFRHYIGISALERYIAANFLFTDFMMSAPFQAGLAYIMIEVITASLILSL